MNRMKAIRAELGMSQTKLTMKTGLTQSILSQIENDKREPHMGWKRKIARAFKMEIADVFPEEKGEEKR